MSEPESGIRRIAVAGAHALLGCRDPLGVERDDVDVWAVALSADASVLGHCLGLLSDEERDRADRFVHKVHRDEYAVAHGLLRHLLSRYLGEAARAIRFGSRPGGKPFVGHPAHPAFSFNLSHSGDRAVIAVGDGREVGVDVEHERPVEEALAIAGTNFSPSEAAAIRQAPAGRQGAEFFRYWVAKEAVVKAQGSGLGLPLDAFEIRFDEEDGGRAVARPIAQGPLEGEWTVRLLTLGPGWPVAACAQGEHWRLRLPLGSPDKSRNQ